MVKSTPYNKVVPPFWFSADFNLIKSDLTNDVRNAKKNKVDIDLEAYRAALIKSSQPPTSFDAPDYIINNITQSNEENYTINTTLYMFYGLDDFNEIVNSDEIKLIGEATDTIISHQDQLCSYSYTPSIMKSLSHTFKPLRIDRQGEILKNMVIFPLRSIRAYITTMSHRLCVSEKEIIRAILNCSIIYVEEKKHFFHEMDRRRSPGKLLLVDRARTDLNLFITKLKERGDEIILEANKIRTTSLLILAHDKKNINKTQLKMMLAVDSKTHKVYCPKCLSSKIHKDGKRRGKQRYLCICGEYFSIVEQFPKSTPELPIPHTDDGVYKDDKGNIYKKDTNGKIIPA